VPKTEDEKKPDAFVKDSVVCEELGVSKMTLFRWDQDPRMAEMGWPPPVILNKSYKYRARSALETFKATMVRRAIEDRDQRMKMKAPGS
jgi:hypothetical protein